MSWTSASLAELSKVITKGTTPTSIGFDFAESGIPFLRVENIREGAVNYLRDTLFISEQTHKALERSQIRPGDILVSIAGTIGRVGIVPDTAPQLNCNQAVAIVRTNGTLFRPFVRHWIESPDAQKQMRASTVTGTISNLSLTQLGNLRIPVPPISEQRRIADVLDRAEALRAKRRIALAQLDSLAQSIFLDLFGNPVVRRSPWPIATLSEVCNKITDGTHHSPPTSSDGIPYITAKHLKQYGLDFESDPWFVSKGDHREIFSRCDPRPGDVLYIKDGATTGIAAVNNYKFEFSMLSSLALLRPNLSRLESSYLCFWLNSPMVKREILGDMAGAAIRRLTLAKIKAIKIPVPTIKLQREFDTGIKAVGNIRSRCHSSEQELDHLFCSLQHRAFQGAL